MGFRRPVNQIVALIKPSSFLLLHVAVRRLLMQVHIFTNHSLFLQFGGRHGITMPVSSRQIKFVRLALLILSVALIGAAQSSNLITSDLSGTPSVTPRASTVIALVGGTTTGFAASIEAADACDLTLELQCTACPRSISDLTVRHIHLQEPQAWIMLTQFADNSDSKASVPRIRSVVAKPWWRLDSGTSMYS